MYGFKARLELHCAIWLRDGGGGRLGIALPEVERAVSFLIVTLPQARSNY